jgi:trimeric autotransporter adhesin
MAKRDGRTGLPSIAVFCVLAPLVSFCAAGAWAQQAVTPPERQSTPSATTGTAGQAVAVQAQSPAATVAGGTLHGSLHGTIKSGQVPLPGVTVTATNTLTGKRFATTTDITGAWSMSIPQNGRYVLRTEFAAFAASTHEALLNATSRDQKVDFDLTLASRAAQQDAREQQQGQAAQIQQAMRQLGVNGAQSVNLLSSLAGGTDAAEGGTTTSANAGAALPGAAGNASFGSDSVAITGQAGSVSPLAGLDPDRVRDAVESLRAQGGAPGGGGFFGGQDIGGGGFGGGGFGGFGGGRGNFRGFRADQPHGAVFWTGSDSALNALPFALRGQEQNQPSYGSNRFGLTFIGQPYIPKLTKPSGKDTLFLTLSGSRTSTPFNEYATIPVLSDDDPNSCAGKTTAACRLLALYPKPNLQNNDQGYNYYLASTGQSNTTQAGVRYIRALGSNATLPSGRSSGGGTGRGAGRRSQTQGLRQSVNANFNWSHSAQDNLNIFPDLGGQTASDNYSVQTGYSIGYHRLNNNIVLGWNRTQGRVFNFYTDATDIASELGVLGPNGPLNTSPLNYGVPNIVISGFTGLNEQQPSFRLQQTISVTETLSWGHGKHNYRFGGDYRRVHQDVLGSGNATGTFYFTDTTDTSGVVTNAALDNFLNDQPTESSIQSTISKSYLRQNVWDLFALDDFRVASNLTLNFGLRYEYFSPFIEKNDHLAELATNSTFTTADEVTPGCSGALCAGLPRSLVFPFHAGIAPRIGIAWRLPKSTVVRAGYGINFTNGQYATFATTLAHEPPFSNVQTNELTNTAITLENGFHVPASAQPPNYALDPHYSLPYVQTWNIDVQKTLPWNILLNAGYNGSKGTHLDITSAPRPSVQNPDVVTELFNYEQAVAFSNFNAGTLRLNKRLQKGISLSANYTYSHSIDNAGSIGGTSTVVAQNWQNLLAEEGNSSFDQRHKVSGTYLFELPFGKDKAFLSGGGVLSKFAEGWSVSGTFTFATGLPLTPTYLADTADVERGTAGSLRPDRVQGVSVTAGAHTLNQWFNTGAFVGPANAFGNASRNSITGPGTISNAMALSKTQGLGDTRSFEFRATASNVFNTVQYAGVDTNLDSRTAGQVTSAAQMRAFNFLARFRF